MYLRKLIVPQVKVDAKEQCQLVNYVPSLILSHELWTEYGLETGYAATDDGKKHPWHRKSSTEILRLQFILWWLS